ncbi:BREX-2 system adenine-specific DNA-methyltransferase PglX [Streptomyces huiliensis]|uniref:BREX-2 system adenine-specific DNA-methyltransferase PglX n=1 Tax=Streptomyces huiliensis TaxID=2876027 RepID=UPI001CBEDF6A|nr:BREX-2 system adenine-specific DNA-methyltransferase PglX [Streptomyces huiliensis]MBZ4322105.1 BREX-2 system adenine-specific DNA-methyltransferase PglX [Streptomyces huiliensis]
MIDRKSLLADLQKQVKAAETDLEQQVKAVSEVGTRLRGEYEQARKLGRTAATWNAWLGERITQVAVAWVLGTVFVRFSEDNQLIAEPYITAPDVAGRETAQARYEEYLEKDADPTYRGWLETAFAELGTGQAGRLLFDRAHNPLYQIPLSHDGAGALLAFWREQRAGEGSGDEGEGGPVLVHDFRDPLSDDGTEGWDTRFLGDLYQDLSEAARKTYALLQTPEFVEEFILDRTMTPAVREFGFEELKMIDPTCGSGHFVLGAFRRLVRMWAEQRPEVGSYERVRAALESVHGVDLNPFAVAVARFRLLVAAMAASGMRTFAEARKYEWPIQLAVGDSLLPTEHRQEGLFGDKQLSLGDSVESGDAEDPYYALSTEDVFEYPQILNRGRYHVVVGNPPYITVKDKTLNQLYRKLYDACAGTYALSVPFAQRFFELAVRGEAKSGLGYGMVGQITANSFMKREFGTKLIESFFRDQVELAEVIDTSGAYIPGHGTPTVILVGRPLDYMGPRRATIRTVRSVQGEPAAPEKAEDGLVWRAITQQVDSPNSESDWISVRDQQRDDLAKHPWSLAGGAAPDILKIVDSTGNRLRTASEELGLSIVTGEDNAFGSVNTAAARQRGARPTAVANGDEVRDWGLTGATWLTSPYDQDMKLLEGAEIEDLLRFMWPLRHVLELRKRFSITMLDRGIPWISWREVYDSRTKAQKLIVYAKVATHNHFYLQTGRLPVKDSAQVIKLRENATAEEHLALLGLLNSSTAGFWLKMVSHDKGIRGEGGGFTSDDWERFYEFTGTKLQEFPLPFEYPTAIATELDALAQQLSATTPAALAAEAVPTASTLRAAQVRYTSLRASMIALQEELDWQVYTFYNLHSEDLHLPNIADVPELALGERAFEIVLARRVATSEASGEWFERHESKPITEIPVHWPADYRALVQRRIEVIESNRAIGMMERPEYKRRWATKGWDAMRQKALKSWLLNRVEDRIHWFDASGNPTVTTLAHLAENLSSDEDFVSVAELYAPRQDLAKTVRELLSEEHVPFVSALRYKPAGLKKRADWEYVWERQREEDAAPDEPAKQKIRKKTPMPPKYTSADFLKPSYWRARGKLDVPKERFISYGTVNVQSPELYGWAGWDHLEQALALASYIQQAGLGDDELVPYLAGLLELQPWLEQWYGEYDPEFGASPAAEILAFRQQKQGELGLTDDALRAWRPAAATRGRGVKKAAVPKQRTSKKAAVQTSFTDVDTDTVTDAVSGTESA